MANFAKDEATYRKPKPLTGNWHYIGDGKSHDPSTGSPEMTGKWTISKDHYSGKSYNKFNEGLKNK